MSHLCFCDFNPGPDHSDNLEFVKTTLQSPVNQICIHQSCVNGITLCDVYGHMWAEPIPNVHSYTILSVEVVLVTLMYSGGHIQSDVHI